VIDRLRTLLGRSVDTTAPDARPAPPPPPQVAVRILTAEGATEVELEGGGERVTELLNSLPEIRVRPPTLASADEAEWVRADLDEILILIPSAQDTDPTRRLHRPGQHIRIRVGPYVIDGAAHVPPGAEAIGFLGRHRPHFVPITGATITGVDGSNAFSEPVAIVNLWMAESARAATDAS
jgi:hypothetical protein